MVAIFYRRIYILMIMIPTCYFYRSSVLLLSVIDVLLECPCDPPLPAPSQTRPDRQLPWTEIKRPPQETSPGVPLTRTPASIPRMACFPGLIEQPGRPARVMALRMQKRKKERVMS